MLGCSQKNIEEITSVRFQKEGDLFAKTIIDHCRAEKRPRNIEDYGPASLDCYAALVLFRSLWAYSLGYIFNRAIERNDPELMGVISLSCYLDTMLESFASESRHSRATACSAIARSIGEACDLYISLLEDPNIAADYVKWDQGFYKFWRKHVSRNKLSKIKLESIQAWKNHRDIATDLTNWHRDEAIFHSESIHPSYRAGLLSLFEYNDGERNHYSKIWPPTRATRFVMMSFLPVISHASPVNELWHDSQPEREFGLLCIRQSVDACNFMVNMR